MKTLFHAIKRMFTLPRRYNSLRDVIDDPIGAARQASETLGHAVVLIRGMVGDAPELAKMAHQLRMFQLSLDDLEERARRLREFRLHLDANEEGD